jgi:hypothetical protein
VRLLWCGAQPMVCQVPARPPTVVGSEEKVWPPRNVTLLSRQVIDLPEMAAKPILERWAIAGVVEVPVGADERELLLQGMQKRHDTLVKRIQEYREQQARNRAAGAEIRLPRAQDRAILKEIKALQAEIAAMDPVMSEALPNVKPAEVGTDPVADELRSFGIAPAAIVVPGTELDDTGFTI